MNNDEYYNQGKVRLDEYCQRLMQIVSGFPQPRQEQVRKMLTGPVGEQFMLAPASTRRAFHNAFPCGLIDHSLRVVDNVRKLADVLDPGRWDRTTLDFVALFHDLGKAGSPGINFYIPVEEGWKREKGEFYHVNKVEFMPNAEKSLFLLQLHGVVITHEESAAIRLNDGMGSAGNQDWAFNEPDLALIVHWADHYAMKTEKAAAHVGM